MANNRRGGDDITEDIMQAIAETADPNMKAILLIVHSGFGKLSAKIDAVLNDEATIKNIVLNGHSATFSDDMTWLHNFRMSRPGGKCPFVVKAEAEEALAQSSKRKILETISAHALTAAATLLGAWLIAGAYMSFKL